MTLKANYTFSSVDTYNSSNDKNFKESGTIVYGTEKDSIDYLSSYIKAHPRMKDEHTHKLICKYYYLNQQYQIFIHRKENLHQKLSEDLDSITKSLVLSELEELETLMSSFPYEETLRNIRETLVIYNLRLILKIANSYAGKGLSVDDLIQEGVFGFLYAIERYDPSKNVKLGTYSTWWIKQKITRSLSNKARLIRLPVHLTIDITKVLGAIRKHKVPYSQKTLPQLSKLTRMKETRVSSAFNHIYSYTPYNQVAKFENKTLASEDPMTTIVDREQYSESLSSKDTELDYISFCLAFEDLLKKLPDSDLEFLSKKFGIFGYPVATKEEMSKLAADSIGKNPTYYKRLIYRKILSHIFKS
jgi:RNA polymerase sigma factor (sigma-70 family)